MPSPALPLPQRFVAWLAPYLGAFSRRSRATVTSLAVGALLAIGPRTVTNCLRALGLAEDVGFARFHRVLNRNVWSGPPPLPRTLRQAACRACGWNRSSQRSGDVGGAGMILLIPRFYPATLRPGSRRKLACHSRLNEARTAGAVRGPPL